MKNKKQTRTAVTKRKPMLIPEEWHRLLHQLADSRKQPMIWYLQGLMAKDADQQKVSRPKLPWE